MFDKKDKKILNLLQEDGRMLLTEISKKVRLSIDAAHKRIKKMKKQEVFEATALIDPRKIGYPLVMDIKIKLKNIDEKTYNDLIKYLIENPFVTNVFSASGDYDLTITIISKDYEGLNNTSLRIRKKFNKIISDWKTAINLKIYKFEKYDMELL